MRLRSPQAVTAESSQAELGVLVHVGLAEEDAALGVEAGGEQDRRRVVEALAQLGRVEGDRDRVQVDDAVDRLAAVLALDVLADRADVVAEVLAAGRLDAGEDAQVAVATLIGARGYRQRSSVRRIGRRRRRLGAQRPGTGPAHAARWRGRTRPRWRRAARGAPRRAGSRGLRIPTPGDHAADDHQRPREAHAEVEALLRRRPSTASSIDAASSAGSPPVVGGAERLLLGVVDGARRRAGSALAPPSSLVDRRLEAARDHGAEHGDREQPGDARDAVVDPRRDARRGAPRRS